MFHFIELTQMIEDPFNGDCNTRTISVAVEQIDFYHDHRIVFVNRAISVSESYNEIKDKIDEAMKENVLIDSIENTASMFKWKSISEIPTERWTGHNNALSPKYLVKCGYDKDGFPILGYTHYSYAANKWIDCYSSTERGIHKPIEWTDIKI